MTRFYIQLLAGIIMGSFLFLFSSVIKAEDDRVIAKVGNETITEEQLQDYINKMSKPGEMLNEKDALDELVARSILYQEAKRNALDQKPDISRKLSECEHNILIGAIMQEESLTKEPLTDKMGKELYDENYMDMRYPRWVKLTVIQVHYTGDKETEAEDYALKIRDKINNDAFEKDQQEALKVLTQTVPPPEGIRVDQNYYEKLFLLKARRFRILLEQEALKLKKGETSDPLKIPRRPIYWLIHVIDEYPQEELPFERVKNEFLFLAAEERYKEKMKAFVDKHKDTYPIEYYQEQ